MISLPRTVVYRLLKINMDHITKNNRIIGAKDLKIDIQIPFYIEINKSEIETILFKNFGNRNGTTVFNSFDT